MLYPDLARKISYEEGEACTMEEGEGCTMEEREGGAPGEGRRGSVRQRWQGLFRKLDQNSRFIANLYGFTWAELLRESARLYSSLSSMSASSASLFSSSEGAQQQFLRQL